MWTNLVEELAQLDGCSAADFVAHRRRLIDHVLHAGGVACAHLVELQQSIDRSLAVCATPRNRLRQLHDELDERLEALAVLTRRLEGAVTPPGGECA